MPSSSTNDWLRALSDRARREPIKLIGLMSGTSADGVDAALVELSGEGVATRVRELAALCLPYPAEVRRRLFSLFAGEGGVAEVCALNVAVAEVFAASANEALRRAGVSGREVLAIGSHGQTVWHSPPSCGAEFAGSLQLGSPAVIAARTGLPVVSDFRAADLAQGGEGAPLVPFVDWLLLTDARWARAVQNIGGIANVTYLPPGASVEAVRAFDTGPGNALVDAAVHALTGGALRFDEDGRIAAIGQVDEALLARWLDHDYFRAAPPKSTGRESFGEPFARRCLREGRAAGRSDADIVATLTALTARSIADAYRRFLGPVDELILCGGGARNPVLVRMLRDALREAGLAPRFRTLEEFGLREGSKEAVAFAILARETLRGRPGNLPSATGAARPAILGSVTPAPL